MKFKSYIAALAASELTVAQSGLSFFFIFPSSISHLWTLCHTGRLLYQEFD